MQDWGALLTSMIFPGLYNDGRQVESPVVIGQFITGKVADSYRPDGNFFFPLSTWPAVCHCEMQHCMRTRQAMVPYRNW